MVSARRDHIGVDHPRSHSPAGRTRRLEILFIKPHGHRSSIVLRSVTRSFQNGHLQRAGMALAESRTLPRQFDSHNPLCPFPVEDEFSSAGGRLCHPAIVEYARSQVTGPELMSFLRQYRMPFPRYNTATRYCRKLRSAGMLKARHLLTEASPISSNTAGTAGTSCSSRQSGQSDRGHQQAYTAPSLPS